MAFLSQVLSHCSNLMQFSDPGALDDAAVWRVLCGYPKGQCVLLVVPASSSCFASTPICCSWLCCVFWIGTRPLPVMRANMCAGCVCVVCLQTCPQLPLLSPLRIFLPWMTRRGACHSSSGRWVERCGIHSPPLLRTTHTLPPDNHSRTPMQACWLYELRTWSIVDAPNPDTTVNLSVIKEVIAPVR